MTRGRTAGELEWFGVVGLSHHDDGFHHHHHDRQHPAVTGEALRALLVELEIDQAVTLRTCNRVELFYRSSRPLCQADDPRLERLLDGLGLSGALGAHLEVGEAALRYLYEVAAALDSMMVGEAQITGQLRRAFEQARVDGHSGPELDALIEGALQVARKVRRGTDIGRGKLSLFSLVLDDVSAHLEGGAAPKVVLVGAGEMIEKVADAMAGGTACHEGTGGPVELLFVNRTVARARALARRFGGTARSLSDFIDAPNACDLVVTATSSPAPVLDVRAGVGLSEGGRRHVLMIDLAVPGDVAAAVGQLRGVTLIDVRGLRRRAEANRRARQRELERARTIIDEELVGRRRADQARALAAAAPRLRRQLEAAIELDPLVTASERLAPLLVRRAQKVLMSELRCRQLDPRPGPAGDVGSLRASLATAEQLDRKAHRRLDPAARAAADQWFDRQAAQLAGTMGRLLDCSTGEPARPPGSPGRADPGCPRAHLAAERSRPLAGAAALGARP